MFKHLNEKGRIPAKTECPFISLCKDRQDVCEGKYDTEISCAKARLIDQFWDEIKQKINK